MIESSIAYLLLLATLVFFAWLGYRESVGKELDNDEFLSARGSQNWIMIGLSLFASGMGVWILFGPSEVGYYGGFYDVMGYALSSATPFLLLAYLGPLIRKLTPEGVTLADYVRQRMGRTMQIYVGVISIIYMFTFMFAEYIAIGRAVEFLSGIDSLVPIIAVALVTTFYTVMGGLPVSIKTDRIQAFFIVWLIGCIVIFIFNEGITSIFDDAKAYNPEDAWSIGSISDYSTFKDGLALVLAITAAEMFSQGNRQRIRASESDDSLRKGAILASVLCFIAVLLFGFLGTVTAGGSLPCKLFRISAKINSASLWDIGDKITVFEIHSKSNTFDMGTMEFLNQSIDIVDSSYKSMIIYNEGNFFSAGANLGEALFLGNIGLESEVDKNILTKLLTINILLYFDLLIFHSSHY